VFSADGDNCGSEVAFVPVFGSGGHGKLSSFSAKRSDALELFDTARSSASNAASSSFMFAIGYVF